MELPVIYLVIVLVFAVLFMTGIFRVVKGILFEKIMFRKLWKWIALTTISFWIGVLFLIFMLWRKFHKISPKNIPSYFHIDFFY